MILYFPKWWEFLTHYGFKYHVNVTEGLDFYLQRRGLKLGRRGDGTSAFNQAYDTFKVKQDKDQTRQFLDRILTKIHGQITLWQIIIIISKSIQKIPAKVWTHYFVVVNLHPH